MARPVQRRSARASRRPRAVTRRPPWLALHARAPEGDFSPLDLAAYAVCALAAAILLVIALGPHRVGDYFTETDFYGSYAQGARLLQQGHLDPSRYGVVGPLYEVTLALVGWAVKDLFRAGELISVLAACGALLLWFLLLKRRTGAAWGLWTIAFLAANPTFLRYGYSATTDALALCLQAAALFALLGMRGRHAPLWAGVLSALAALTRYSAIYLVPGAFASYLWLAPAEGMSKRRAVILFLAGFAAPILPWLAISLRSGQAPGTALFHNIAYDVYARSRGITWDEYQARLQPQFRSWWDVLKLDPQAVFRREVQNVLEHLRQDLRVLLGAPAAWVCGAGLVLAFLDGTARKLAPLLLCGLFLFLSLVPAFYSERYSLPLAPIYLSLAGAAVASPLLALRIRGWGLRLKWALGLWPLWLAGSASVAYQSRIMSQLPVELLPAGRVLRESAEPGARVMARKPHIAYYGGLTPIPFPLLRSLPELADYCHRERVDYIYFSWPEAELRPNFWYLLDTSAVIPGLAVVTFVRHNPAVVYRVGPDFGRPPDWQRDPAAMALHVARGQVLVNPDDWRARYNLGFFAHEDQRYEEALRHLAVATRGRPDLASAWLLQGSCHLHLGQLLAAREAYGRALALEPENTEARAGLGWVELRAGRPELAARAWRPIIHQVQDVATLRRMDSLFRQLGDLEAADDARTTLAARGG